MNECVGVCLCACVRMCICEDVVVMDGAGCLLVF